MPQTPGFTTLTLFCITETIQQIFITEPQISSSQLSIPHPVSSTLTWVWSCAFSETTMCFVLCMSLCPRFSSLLLSTCVSPSVSASFRFPPSLFLLQHFDPALLQPVPVPAVPSPQTLCRPLTAQSCVLPAISVAPCPPWSGARGLHPLSRRGWGWGGVGSPRKVLSRKATGSAIGVYRGRRRHVGARTRLRAILTGIANSRLPHRATGLGTSHGDAARGDRDDLPARGTRGFKDFTLPGDPRNWVWRRGLKSAPAARTRKMETPSPERARSSARSASGSAGKRACAAGRGWGRGWGRGLERARSRSFRVCLSLPPGGFSFSSWIPSNSAAVFGSEAGSDVRDVWAAFVCSGGI